MNISKGLVILRVILLPVLVAFSDASPPIPPGRYTFAHRFAEHPGMPGASVTVTVEGFHLSVTNQGALASFPRGVIAEGTLMWHAASGQWIIGHADTDRFVEEVGGCTEGPEVVDLQRKEYWTC